MGGCIDVRMVWRTGRVDGIEGVAIVHYQGEFGIDPWACIDGVDGGRSDTSIFMDRRAVVWNRSEGLHGGSGYGIVLKGVL